jgi:hypothetical protein
MKGIFRWCNRYSSSLSQDDKSKTNKTYKYVIVESVIKVKNWINVRILRYYLQIKQSLIKADYSVEVQTGITRGKFPKSALLFILGSIIISFL